MQSPALIEVFEGPDTDKVEEQETGDIEFSVIKDYWNALGLVIAVTIILSLFLMQASRNLSDWWLSYWVTHISHNSTSVMLYASKNLENWLDGSSLRAYKVDEVTYYLTVYGLIAGFNSVSTLARAFLFAYGGVKAAAGLHTKLIKSVLRVCFKLSYILKMCAYDNL